ncbi:hypothetical protein KC950_00040 [Candidatus Saccharibacteria bacterium]|nr:hypothetical protein [Candidatus Saccharibacteria bacterium]
MSQFGSHKISPEEFNEGYLEKVHEGNLKPGNRYSLALSLRAHEKADNIGMGIFDTEVVSVGSFDFGGVTEVEISVLDDDYRQIMRKRASIVQGIVTEIFDETEVVMVDGYFMLKELDDYDMISIKAAEHK